MNPLHPYGGPEPRSDVRQLTDDAEVRECRRILYMTARGADMDWLSESEQRWGAGPTTEELAGGVERDLELWGESPFAED